MIQDGKKRLGGEPSESPIDTRYVAAGLSAVVLLACAAIVLFFIFYSEKTAAWGFIAALTLIFAGFVHYLLSLRDTKALYEDMQRIVEKSSTQTKEEVKTIIQQNIDPHLTILRSKKEVRSAAAQMINTAIKEKHEFGVIYFGAASSSSTAQEVRDAHHVDSNEFSDVLQYQNSQDDLKNCAIPVIRYINLGEAEVFALRSAGTRQQLLAWFEIQVVRLKTNPNYTLYDARRAPEWGGPLSSIITKNSMLEIIGDGWAGRLLTSQRMPTVHYTVSKEYFWAAKEDRNKPQRYTVENVQQLEKKLEAFRTVHRQRLDIEFKAKGPEIRPAA